MKIILTFKSPDVLEQVEIDKGSGDYENFLYLFHKYTQYEEYVDIEFDTITKEVKVLPRF